MRGKVEKEVEQKIGSVSTVLYSYPEKLQRTPCLCLSQGHVQWKKRGQVAERKRERKRQGECQHEREKTGSERYKRERGRETEDGRHKQSKAQTSKV
jgi:hypothetical protein